MTRNLEGRLAKLEFSRKPRGGYVVHVSKPPTASELAEIELARIEGRAIVVLPHVCKTVDEWLASVGGSRVPQ